MWPALNVNTNSQCYISTMSQTSQSSCKAYPALSTEVKMHFKRRGKGHLQKKAQNKVDHYWTPDTEVAKCDAYLEELGTAAHCSAFKKKEKKHLFRYKGSFME